MSRPISEDDLAPRYARLTTALNADHDPVVNVVRLGLHEDAALIVTLRSGAEIRFERQAEMFLPDAIARRASLVGLRVKLVTKAGALAFAQDLIAQATVQAETSVRLENRAMLRRFLFGVLTAGHVELFASDDSAARFRAFDQMQRYLIGPDGYTPAIARAVALVDSVTGTRYLRVTDFALFVREERGKGASYPVLHSLALEAGWLWHGELVQRGPGDVRARINPYLVLHGWEDTDDPPEVT